MEFQKRVDEIKRIFNGLRTSLRLREDQSKKGETTYTLDAEIRGSFTDLDTELGRLSTIVADDAAGKSSLAPKDIEKRKKTLADYNAERDKLRSWFDSFFEKKVNTDIYTGTGDKETKFTEKYDTTGLNTKQLNQLRTHELNQQDEAVEGLIGVVKEIKYKGMAMDKEFVQQKEMLNELEDHVDNNTQKIGRVRSKMMKLLEKSSNCCLGIVITLEIVAIILLFVL